MFLPHFDVFCDQLLNRPTEIWNLFVLCHKPVNYVIYASVHCDLSDAVFYDQLLNRPMQIWNLFVHYVIYASVLPLIISHPIKI